MEAVAALIVLLLSYTCYIAQWSTHGDMMTCALALKEWHHIWHTHFGDWSCIFCTLAIFSATVFWWACEVVQYFRTYFKQQISCKHYFQISRHTIGSWNVRLESACFNIWKQTSQQILAIMWGWLLTVQCQVTVLRQLPGTGSSLKATARVCVAGVRGVKLTRNSAPPSGSTLVGRCSPILSITTSSRLPSPAAAASTRLG